MRNKKMVIGATFINELIDAGINTDDVLNFISKYNKKQNTVTTTFKLSNGNEHILIKDCMWYAARKNKRW